MRPGMTPERPTIHHSVQTVTWKTWGEEVLLAHAPGLYTLKLLKRYAAGQRGGLQFHHFKHETFHLLSGEVDVYFVDVSFGALRVHRMFPGETFIVPPGAIHSVQTVTDSVMVEASTPVFDDRENVEADYDISTAVAWP